MFLFLPTAGAAYMHDVSERNPVSGPLHDTRAMTAAAGRGSHGPTADAAIAPAGEDPSAHLQALIELGLARGFVTRGDIVDALPQHSAEDAQIAAATLTLGDLGVAVHETAGTRTEWTPGNHFANANEVSAPSLDLLVGHTTDPLRLYLREMGATPLLDRGEEFALALCLERGRAACAHALARDPDALDALASIQSEIADGKTPATHYVSAIAGTTLACHSAAPDNEETQPATDDDARHDDKAWREAVVTQLENAGALATAMREALRCGGPATPAYGSLKRQSAELTRPLRFTARAIERLCEPLRQRVAETRRLERRLATMLTEAGVDIPACPSMIRAPSSGADVWIAACLAAHPERRSALLARVPVLAETWTSLAELSETSSLPGEAALALDARLTRIERAVQQARLKLFKSNLRLVVSVAKRYLDRGLPLPDLIQEGNIGLMKAVDRYDVQRGFRFSTYATWWIRQAMTHALAEQGRMIRLPVHTADAVNRLARLAREHLQDNGRAATPAALASQMGVPVEKVRDLMCVVKEPVSTDLPVAPESDQTLRDAIADAHTPSPADYVNAAQMRDAVASMIGGLPPRQALVLRLRYGIGGACERSLGEIGEQLNLSAERVRQIEVAALKRIRSSEHLPRLRTLLGYNH